MAYSNDEFAYGIFAPELSHADELKKERIEELLAKKDALQTERFELDAQIEEIDEELADLEVGS